MSAVASQNRYDLLGNDIEDPDAPPPTAPKEVTRNTTTSKKNEEKATPFAQSGNTNGGRRPQFTGNDKAFRDRDAGRGNNRSKGTEEEGSAPRSYRGNRGPRREFDRHSGTGKTDSEKKVSQGWGSKQNEWNDEIIGEELAQKEAAGANPQDANAVSPADAPAVEAETTEEVPEPEEKVKTLDEYHAELEQLRADLGPPTQIRRPNEGTQNDKKWAVKELSRKEEEEGIFFAGESKDKTRNRERKQKNLLELDRSGYTGGSGRGDRGGGRGGRGRGDRGDHDGRGRGRWSKDQRDASSWTQDKLSDNSAFPALGS